MLLAQARADVVAACQRLRREGLVVGTAGNVSVRSGEHVAMSPSGLDYDDLTAELVGVHDLAGIATEARLAPSSELPLHLAAYANSAASSVVHTHAPSSTALSTVVAEVPCSHYYSAMFGGAVPVAPYATYGSPELAGQVGAALTHRTAALLANHGAVILADSADQACQRAAYLEYICDVHLRALATGLPVAVLSDEEIAQVGLQLAGYGQGADGSAR